jgi:hypothetical protein
MAVEDRRRWLLRGSVLGLALVVALVAWLTTGDGDEPAAVEETTETRILSAAEVGDLAALSGHPVYWAGRVPGAELEATESSDGSVQIRYLEEAAEAGDESAQAQALTVGSYPLPDPAGALATFAASPGSVTHRGAGGREVVVSEQNPTSAYFASPDGTVQVEVYDPSPKRALALALSAKVRPAG